MFMLYHPFNLDSPYTILIYQFYEQSGSQNQWNQYSGSSIIQENNLVLVTWIETDPSVLY